MVLARFFHPQRQGEDPCFQRWFESQGYRVEAARGGLRWAHRLPGVTRRDLGPCG